MSESRMGHLESRTTFVRMKISSTAHSAHRIMVNLLKGALCDGYR
jgi:hypothetical protein